MEPTPVQKAMEVEHNEFTTKDSATYYKGFISRRKAANDALRSSDGMTSREMTQLAEVAAFYNKTLRAATNAFRLNPSELLGILEGVTA